MVGLTSIGYSGSCRSLKNSSVNSHPKGSATEEDEEGNLRRQQSMPLPSGSLLLKISERSAAQSMTYPSH